MCDNIKTKKDYTYNQLEFAIFCIESVAKKLNIDGPRMYDVLKKDNDILDNYIVPLYDVLHTQSKDYIVNDIIDVMKKEGIKI